MTNRTFRLPTEAEWEYAARGGNNVSRRLTYAGSEYLGKVAWYSQNSDNRVHPVKTKIPNELGLYDMSGNVYEWCQDWYGQYDSADQENPKGDSVGSTRVIRGGSWNTGASYSRVTNRGSDTPSNRNDFVGFRLVMNPSITIHCTIIIETKRIRRW